MIQHPRGNRARILLTSVFKPFAQDDEFGSRAINPAELYHNQVTREQGPFSLRMFHRSWGLMFLQQNISAPCTVLDFPTRKRFIRELRTHDYDIVGISGIVVNVGKVREMCRLAREHSPGTTIVVGGHVTAIPGIERMLDADHVVKGEGVAWLREFLGEPVERPILHPMIPSSFGFRIMGLPSSPGGGGNQAATIIPSVGCPMGCNFCTTSSFFGGKGKVVNFFETGDDLFRVMSEAESKLRVNKFFIMDENFLLYKRRALELLDRMRRHHKPWTMYVFSSANAIKQYDIRQLVELGIGWVWMGLEGDQSAYDKLQGVDTHALVNRLQAHGIRVLGSSIIGLEDHRPENMDAIIDHAVSHDTVFHQFMLYTPIPGTPLYEKHRQDGSLFTEKEFPVADAHGQYRFNYRHSHIKDGLEEGYLLEAFRRDFAVNGPSVLRLIRVILNGWQRYKDAPVYHLRKRVAWEVFPLRSSYAGAVWAMRKWYRNDPLLSEKADKLLKDIYAEFGWITRLITPAIGRFAHFKLKREEERLAAGWSYEPASFSEKNAAALALGTPYPAGKKAEMRGNPSLVDIPAGNFSN